jgi:hypothetical protein
MTTNTEREASQPINRPPRVDMTGGRSGTVMIERHQKRGANRVHGRLVDLSRGGVKISVDCCIPFDETVTLTAEFPEIHFEFHVLADVRWSRQGDGDTWLIGCCFKPGLPDETVERLSNEGYLERRCNPRYPISCDAEAQWELSDESVPVRIADFSAEGFCIVSPRVGKTGQQFQLELKDSDGEPVRVAARMCWQSNAEDGYLVGAEFLNRSDSHRLWEIAYQTTPNQPLRLRVPLTPSRWMVTWFAALIAIIIAYPPLVRLLAQHDSVAAEWSSGAAAAATDGHLEASTRPAAAPQPSPPVENQSPAAQTAAQPRSGTTEAATQDVQPAANQDSEEKRSWQAYRQRQQAKLDKQTRELADQAVQLTRLEVALQQKQAQSARRLQRRQNDVKSQRMALLAEQSAWASKQRERTEATRTARPADLAASLEAAFDLTAPSSPATPTPVEQPQQTAANPPAASESTPAAVSESTPLAAPQFTPPAAPQFTPAAATTEPQLIASSDRIPVSPADSTPPTAAEDATPTTIQEEAPVDVAPARPLTTAQPAAPAEVTQPSEPADVVPSTAAATALDVAADTPPPPAVPPAAITTEADRKTAFAALRRGRQQLEMRQYADAVLALQEVVGLQPQDPLAHYLLALAHHQNGDQTAADQHIWAGAELEQQDPIANWGRAMQRYQGRPRLWLERARARAKKDSQSR